VRQRKERGRLQSGSCIGRRAELVASHGQLGRIVAAPRQRPGRRSGPL